MIRNLQSVFHRAAEIPANGMDMMHAPIAPPKRRPVSAGEQRATNDRSNDEKKFLPIASVRLN